MFVQLSRVTRVTWWPEMQPTCCQFTHLFRFLPRIETTSPTLPSRLVPWGLKYLHVWHGGANRPPWGRPVSVTPQTPGPLRWSGPGRSTCWFSWWGTGAGRRACRRAGRPDPGSRCCRSAPGRSRTCSCGRCPGRAPPTAGSPSGRAGRRPGIGCGGQSRSRASCMQTSEREGNKSKLNTEL